MKIKRLVLGKTNQFLQLHFRMYVLGDITFDNLYSLDQYDELSFSIRKRQRILMYSSFALFVLLGISAIFSFFFVERPFLVAVPAILGMIGCAVGVSFAINALDDSLIKIKKLKTASVNRPAPVHYSSDSPRKVRTLSKFEVNT